MSTNLYHVVMCDDPECHSCVADDWALCSTYVGDDAFGDDPSLPTCLVCDELARAAGRGERDDEVA